ncbi:DNA mismatch repair protein MutS [Mucilaginibacter hurinus]|uniref:DNA mismatch repair protein MutS n=1 Tax=Mucilaginibacter hurinus TaxID=2201324 RepID=A0A367GSH6_9SPHI|nr:Smr/MutS family protein [Mucilaginibacter hurinus]RCH56384.1 DNA mismatch repair protein MutS [Mucilaginibacter hurinus]
MKYKLGDFVRFVDEKMEGFVTRIIDEQMIGVTGDDDFEIPVLASKVTTVHGYNGGQPEGNTQKSTETTIPDAEFVLKGVYLGAMPDAKAPSVVHFNILNQTSFQLLVSLTTVAGEKFKGEFSGIIAPKSATQVYSAQLADLQLWPKITLHIIYHTPQNIQPPEPLLYSEKFKAKDFAGAKTKLPVLGQQGWLFRLDEPELVLDAGKLKESFYTAANEKVTTIEKPLSEVDLHIEKLRDDYQFLSSADIMNIQLNHFNKTLDAAVVQQLPEIVFIHGAGNGILRHELHKLLSKHSKVQTFMDARKEKFGYGATKAILK